MRKGGASRAPTGDGSDGRKTTSEQPVTGRTQQPAGAAPAARRSGHGRRPPAEPPTEDLSHEPVGDDLLIDRQQGMHLRVKTLGLLTAEITSPVVGWIAHALAALIGAIALVVLAAGLGVVCARCHLSGTWTALVILGVPLTAAAAAVVVAFLRPSRR